MTKRMLIDAAHADETRVVIIDNDRVEDYDFITSSKAQVKGNIYLAKITRVEPSLQAAFVEYGGGKQGFLPFSEIHPDYYQLPQDDKQKLLEEQIAEAEAEEAAEDAAFEREQAAREGRRQPREDGDEESFNDADMQDIDSGGETKLIQSLDTPTDTENLQPLSVEPASSYTPLPAIESFTPPQPEGDVLQDEPDYQPLQSESFAVHSSVSDLLPEETLSAHSDSIESGAQSMEFEANNTALDNISDGETTSEDAEETRNSVDRDARGFHRRYRIQEVIKRNQIVLVQVIKEERGNKGCSLTTFISLAGRCAVLMPNSPKGGGISRKITDRETRRRLKEVASEMRTHRGMSVIIRTAGIDRTTAEIRRDYEYLVKLWNDVRTQTLESSAPALIYEEGNLVKRSLRDQYSNDIEEVIIEGEAAFEDAKNFMRMLMPAHANRVKLYKDTMPLFSFAGVEEQLLAMTEPQVKLPSGGYLVINPTEALISIDVNSGRSTTERNVEETALKTNLEAAAEVGRQLRLRDLAGIIVIDFIDMGYGKNRKAVERAMKDALRNDRAKISMARISMFGLLELSRQRMRPSIAESMGTMCPHCRGTGHIYSVETVGIQIIRALEKEAASNDYSALRVTTTPEAALHLLNDKRGLLQSIEQRYNVSVIILMDTALITGHSSMIKVTKDGKEILHDAAQAANKRGGAVASRGRRARRGPENQGSGRSLNFSGAVEASTDEYIPEIIEGDDEVLITGESATSVDGETQRPRRERSDRPDRGGRNRNRGGRNRDRDRDRTPREPREPRIEGETPAVVNADGTVDATATPREPREDRGNRRRGRRGGRNRNDRDRAPRTDAPAGDAAASDNVMPMRSSYSSESRVETAVYSAEPAKQPRVIPLSEAQTNPAAIASPIRSEDNSGSEKPKRKGWWARVLED